MEVLKQKKCQELRQTHIRDMLVKIASDVNCILFKLGLTLCPLHALMGVYNIDQVNFASFSIFI